MEMSPNLQLSEFQKALKKRLLSFQVTAVMLFLGATAFLGVLLLLYSQNPPQESYGQASSPEFLSILSIVHLCLACACYAAAFFIYRYLTSWKGLKRAIEFPQVNLNREENTLEMRACLSIFTAYIIRAAFMEGPAMLGMIACLMGVTEGEIQDKPIYWLNLFSYILFAVMVLWTFPTTERLEDIFQRRFMV